MILSIIAALDKRHGIGRGGQLPWRIPSDLKRFKALTLGHHLIMGRKTYESIGKPLPGRTNIVVTRKADYQPAGVVTANSIQDALDIALQNGEKEVFIIGGGEIFRQVLPIADRLYLTYVDVNGNADVFFPEIDKHWKPVSVDEIPHENHDQYSTTFRIYART